MIEDEQITQPETGEQPWSPAQPEASAAPTSDTTADAQPPATNGATSEPAAADGRLAELEALVADLQGQLSREREAATDYMNRWQRVQADFSNYKRRAQHEQEQQETQIAGRVVATMLPALDSFERAFATLPTTLRGFSWIDGIALVHLQLHNALAALGIQEIAAEPGHAFDPLRHEAIGEIESAEHPDGHIAVLVQRGYEAKGLLLRPALVQIARPPRQAASDVTQEAGSATAAADGGEASGA